VVNRDGKEDRRQSEHELEMEKLGVQLPKELLEELSIRAMVEERRVADIIIELIYNYLNK